MMHVELNLIAEPSYYQTHWYKNIMKGVDHEIARRGLTLKIRILDNLKNANAIKYYEKRRLIIILGTSVSWIRQTINDLGSIGLQPLLIYSQLPNNPYPYSYITLNHLEASSDITRYLISSGCNRIAFFGMNPESLADVLKYRGFRRVLSELNIPFSDEDLYLNKGSIQDTIMAFSKKYENYDSILCVNDIVAILLMQHINAKLNKPLADYYIAGFGDSLAGRIFSPSLTTVTLDFFEAGRKAVDLYTLLIKNPNIVSSSITISSTIKIRQSTRCKELDLLKYKSKAYHEIERVDFYHDSNIKEVFTIESLLQRCDKLDGDILNNLLNDLTYEQSAEKLNITITPLKYRIQKMLASSGLKTKDELLLLIAKYFGKDAGIKIASFKKEEYDH